MEEGLTTHMLLCCPVIAVGIAWPDHLVVRMCISVSWFVTTELVSQLV